MFNYNTSPELLRNARRKYRKMGARLIIAEGHIVAGKDGIIARFKNDEAAAKCLVAAGYKQVPRTDNNLIFLP